MHVSLAVIIGILVIVAAILIYVALAGIPFVGLAANDEEALGVTLFAVALIIAGIFAAGVRAQFKRVKTGKEALIGAKGTAITDLNPKGTARVNGEFWEAATQDIMIKAGQQVEVVGMDGMTLVVKPANKPK
jgi:membrane-bound serine protease (ClpP class)